MIRLFEIENGIVIPTEHCKMLRPLRVIQENYPDEFLAIYGYLFYMTCPSQENPFYNVPFIDREELILNNLSHNVPTEDDAVIEALDFVKELFETPTVRTYKAITTMLDNLSVYIENAAIRDGKDGNINTLIKVAKEFDDIRKSYKGIARDLEEEQTTIVRGGQHLAYDQE